MIACYCRISSYDQKPDSQKAELKRWLKGNKIRSKDVQWFEDVESGATTKRPVFEQMQKAVFNGEVNTLVVWKSTSRFSFFFPVIRRAKRFTRRKNRSDILFVR